MLNKKHMMTISAVMAMGLLTACSTPSQITTTDGETVISADEPKVNKDDGFVTYEKDGKEVQMNQDQVRSIEPIE